MGYRLIWLNEYASTMAEQSRGLTLQFNGYLLLSDPNEYIKSLITAENNEALANLTLNSLYENDCYAVMNDISYSPNTNSYMIPVDGNYTNYINYPGSHMFTSDFVSQAGDEVSFSANNTKCSTTSVIFDIKPSQFNKNLIYGNFNINGFILMGQAYNQFNQVGLQAKLENAVPLAIVYLDDVQTVSNSVSNAAVISEKLLFTLSQGAITGVSIDTEWKNFAGTLSKVNDGLGTVSSYILNADKVSANNLKDLSGNSVYTINSRLFMSDNITDNYNNDFASLAKLNIMTSAQDNVKAPQLMLSKSSASSSDTTWDGIAATYYKKDGQDSFDIDYIGENGRLNANILTTDYYTSGNYGTILVGGGSITANDNQNSTYFRPSTINTAASILSACTGTTVFGPNRLSKDSQTFVAGNANIINSATNNFVFGNSNTNLSGVDSIYAFGNQLTAYSGQIEKTPTYLLGSKNSNYIQTSYKKQIVVGGETFDSNLNNLKYNSFEFAHMSANSSYLGSNLLNKGETNTLTIGDCGQYASDGGANVNILRSVDVSPLYFGYSEYSTSTAAQQSMVDDYASSYSNAIMIKQLFCVLGAIELNGTASNGNINLVFNPTKYKSLTNNAVADTVIGSTANYTGTSGKSLLEILGTYI